jgi:hypothetical protein
MVKFVKLQVNLVLLDNSIIIKMESAQNVAIHALNVNMLPPIVQLALQDLLWAITNVLKLTVAELEDSELNLVHVNPVHPNVVIVLVPLNVQLVLQDMFSTVMIVSFKLEILDRSQWVVLLQEEEMLYLLQ